MSVIIEILDDTKDFIVDDVPDYVADVGDFFVDEIVDPVVNVVEDVVDAALDDPIKTIATVAAVATGNAWAIPLIEGADVAIDGGDIGDILEATAKAYVAQQVGAAVGKYAGSAAKAEVVAAGGSKLEQQVAQQIIGSGSARATQAVIYGQDPVEAFAKGGVSAGISASLGQLETNSAYKDLPQSAKNVISDSLTAAFTGKEITPELVTSAIVRGQVTSDFMRDQLDPVQYDEFGDELPQKFTDGQIAAITNAIVNSTTAAFTGKDIAPELMKAVLKYGSEELNKVIDKPVRNTIDKVSGKYDLVSDKAEQVDDAVADYETAAANYNTLADQLATKFEARDALKANVDALRSTFQNDPSQGNADKLNAAITEYNNYTTSLDAEYEKDFKPLLDQYKAEADTALSNIDTFRAEYNTLKDDLVSSADQLDEALVPIQKGVDKSIVRALTDDTFVPDEYIKYNGLDDDAAAAGEEFDAHYHWLTEGKDKYFVTNKEEYDKSFALEKENFLNKALNAANLDLTHMSKEQRKDVFAQVDKIATEQYENNLTAFKNADASNYGEQIAQDFLREQDFIKDVLTSEGKTDEEIEKYIKGQKLVNSIHHSLANYKDTEINKEKVTDADIVNNNAYVSLDKEGDISWLNRNARNSNKYWDPKENKMVQNVAIKDGFEKRDLDGNTILKVEQAPLLTADKLLETNVKAGIENYATITDEDSKKVIEASLGSTTWMFIQQAYKYAKSEDAPNWYKDTAGVVLRAGGELLQSFNGLMVLVNENPADTSLGKFARKVIKMGDDVTTEEYKNNLKEIRTTIAAANKDTDPNAPWYERAWNTTKAIYDGASKAPLTFAAEYIAKEVMQEIPLLIVSGGTANLAKKALIEGGEAYAKKMGLRAGVSTSVGLSMAEGFGGTAVETFDDAYKTAIKGGMNETQATEYAFDLAKEAGTISAVTTLATGKLLKGNDFEKAILGDKKGSGNLSEAFNVISKEMIQEAFEEGLPKAWAETQLIKIDPERDAVGNTTANVILGMISGGGTSATIYGTTAGYDAVENKLNPVMTGDFVSSAIATFNPEVNETLKTDKTTENMSVIEQNLTDLGLDSNITSNIMNTYYDDAYIGSEEVYNKYQEFGKYKPTQEEVDKFVGKTTKEQFNIDFDAYIDPRFVDEQEIKNIATSEGVTLTDEEIQQYTGQKTESEILEQARKDLDPKGVTEEEAREYFTNLGYTPTDEEVKQFTGNVNELEQATKLGEYVDPLMTSKEEAKSYFDALGYNATEEEINNFVGQVAQVDQKTAIGEYVDPRMVTEAEAVKAFKDAGLTEVRTEDAQKLMGQYDQSLLAGKVGEALPEARFNVLKDMISQPRPEVDAIKDIIGKPASGEEDATGLFAELSKIPGIQEQLSDFTYSVEEQGQDINAIANLIGKPASKVTDADLDFVSDIIAQNETLADTGTFDFTDEMLQYDLTGDKKVDAADQQILQDLQTGKQVDFTPTKKFTEATGIYDILNKQQQDTTRAFADLEQNITNMFTKQAEDEATEKAATAKRKRQMDLSQQLFAQLQPQQVTPQKPVELAKIGDPYQFESIFRDAGQEAFYQTPYNKGGQVDNLNDTLLKLIGDK